ncbi:hypothetical protein [Sphingomonas sp. MMS24-J13]|uniref:hypothetical protein n=1 Tax=Sphingomonas sp. MMS24-J13 TaxID=3238686 RepID=UPI0038502669
MAELLRHTVSALMSAFDASDARAREMQTLPGISNEDLDAWCDAAGSIGDLVEALPNTPAFLQVRARAVGSLCDNTADLDKLSLSELSAHAEGQVGRLVRQILACCMTMGADHG